MSDEINIELEDVKVREFFARIAGREDVLLQYGGSLFQLKLRSVRLSQAAIDFLKESDRTERS